MARMVTNEIGVRGLPCPWCQVIVQPPPGLTAPDGLAQHLRVVHPERA